MKRMILMAGLAALVTGCSTTSDPYQKRVEAERDLMKTAKNDICDDLQLNRKVLNKLARTYHKGNYNEEVEMHKDFEELYETVTKKAS
jgi:PBP1b-binding outer membrane lipoprotein LpoB